jgi:hypothetical protein
MQQRTPGQQGLTVPELGYGAMGTAVGYGPSDDSESITRAGVRQSPIRLSAGVRIHLVPRNVWSSLCRHANYVLSGGIMTRFGLGVLGRLVRWMVPAWSAHPGQSTPSFCYARRRYGAAVTERQTKHSPRLGADDLPVTEKPAFYGLAGGANC